MDRSGVARALYRHGKGVHGVSKNLAKDTSDSRLKVWNEIAVFQAQQRNHEGTLHDAYQYI
jgi:hypothetical protein